MAPRVAVIGSANVDLVVRVGRRPVAGETVLTDRYSVWPGGKGANQAVAAARAGADVTFVGCVAADGWGSFLRDELVAAGVDIAHLQTASDSVTGAAFITVSEDGENQIIVASGANARVLPETVRSARPALEEADVLCLQLEIPLESVEEACLSAQAAGTSTVLTPAPASARARELVPLADVVVPNLGEGRMLAELGESSSPEEVALTLRARGARSVVLTLGAEGALVATADDGVDRVPALEHGAPVDTTAAGDTLAGYLASRLASGDDLLTAVRWGVAAAGISVTRPGAQASIPSWDEVISVSAAGSS